MKKYINMERVKMVDISEKKDIVRIAKAKGRIKLKRETIERIKRGEIEKGDVFSTSHISAIIAAKKTPEILPLCHNINITNVKVNFYVKDSYIEVETIVKAVAKTGVEMEALVACAAALLNIWDMVKKYEKDENGQYPHTRIEEIYVEEKIKLE